MEDRRWQKLRGQHPGAAPVQLAYAAGTRRVVEWWLRRWALGRIEREDVRERMRSHRLVHPIRHGARVPRPRRDADQRRLFEE